MSPPLLLDACVVINLRAAGLWKEIREAAGAELAVSRQVARESLSTLNDEGDAEAINLEALEQSGELSIFGLDADEVPLFVELGRQLGDGEASTLAIACKRRWPAATDDRRARRIASELAPAVDVRTTPDLIRTWATATESSSTAVARVVQRIRDRARYVAPEGEPNSDWWHALLRKRAA